MIHIIVNHINHSLVETSAVPVTFLRVLSQKMLATCKLWYASGVFGEILFRNLYYLEQNVFIRYFQVLEPCTIQYRLQAPYLCVQMLLQNEGHYFSSKSEGLICRENQYNLFYLPDGWVELYLKSSGLYIVFEAGQTIQLERLRKQYPLIGKAIQTEGRKPVWLYNPSPPASTAIHLKVQELLQPDITDIVAEPAAQNQFAGILYPFITALQEKENGPAAKKYQENIEAARAFIEANFTDEITVASLSHKFGMNSTYFKTYFKKYVGLTAAAYQRQVRMDYALVILQKGVSVKDVAYAVGYDTVSGFIEAYVKSFGITPLKAQQQSYKQ